MGRLAEHINAGDAHSAIELLRSGTYAEIEWSEKPSAFTDDAAALAAAGLRRYVDVATKTLRDPGALLAALGDFRVLCAQREGPRGVASLNRYLGEHFRTSVGVERNRALRDQWFAGSAIIVLRNDPVLKLYNGDVGIVLPTADDDSLAAHFADGNGGFRTVALARLPEHEAAFATTVHKAQGSEFNRVILLLPAVASRVVTRELLYTAITRARSGVTIVASTEVLEKAIATPTRRYSGLGSRLADSGERRS
jgi:exodeoxyribonuclease V alpha subunit